MVPSFLDQLCAYIKILGSYFKSNFNCFYICRKPNKQNKGSDTGAQSLVEETGKFSDNSKMSLLVLKKIITEGLREQGGEWNGKGQMSNHLGIK